MRPVGIFKCPHISNDNENRTPTPDPAPTKQHEWDTPTRVTVKVLSEGGHSRQSMERQTKVPVRFQQRILKEPDRRNGENGENGKNRAGALHKLSKRDARMMIRHLAKSCENKRITWQQLARDHGGGCRPNIVKTAMNKEGYYKCKACHVIEPEQHDCRKGPAWVLLLPSTLRPVGSIDGLCCVLFCK